MDNYLLARLLPEKEENSCNYDPVDLNEDHQLHENAPTCCALCVRTQMRCQNRAIHPKGNPRFCNVHYKKCKLENMGGGDRLGIIVEKYESNETKLAYGHVPSLVGEYGIMLEKYDWKLRQLYQKAYISYGQLESVDSQLLMSGGELPLYSELLTVNNVGPCANISSSSMRNSKILWCSLYPAFQQVRKVPQKRKDNFVEKVYNHDQLEEWKDIVLMNLYRLMAVRDEMPFPTDYSYYKQQSLNVKRSSLLNPVDMIVLGLIIYRTLIELIFFRDLCSVGGDDCTMPDLIRMMDFTYYMSAIFHNLGMIHLKSPNAIENMKEATKVIQDVDMAIDIIIAKEDGDDEQTRQGQRWTMIYGIIEEMVANIQDSISSLYHTTDE